MNYEITVDIPLEQRQDLLVVRQKIQTAIDSCAARGGGIVSLPPGDYLASSIMLKSNVHLQLAKDCQLISPVQEADFVQVQLHSKEDSFGADSSQEAAAIIMARGCENISVTGGSLVGQGQAFWTKKAEILPSWQSTPPRYQAKPFRPHSLLMQNCHKVRISGLTINASPVYSAWLLSCSQVWIDHCQVNNDFYGPNTDGFHFSSCLDVLVEDCDFVTGDDAIAVDANDSGFSEKTIIRRCTFNSAVNVIRIYTGLDPFIQKSQRRFLVRDVRLYRCKVKNAAGVLNITAQNGTIENIRCFNMEINQEIEGTPVFIMTDQGLVRDVVFSDSQIQSNGIGTIIGTASHPVQDIRLENLTYTVKPMKKLYELDIPDPIPGYWQHHFAPCNLFLRHLEGCLVKNLQVDWLQNPDFAHAFSALTIKNCQDITIEKLAAQAYDQTGYLPALALEQGRNINYLD